METRKYTPRQLKLLKAKYKLLDLIKFLKLVGWSFVVFFIFHILGDFIYFGIQSGSYYDFAESIYKSTLIDSSLIFLLIGISFLYVFLLSRDVTKIETLIKEEVYIE